MQIDHDELKRRARAMWSAGDYDEMATTFEEVCELVVEVAGVQRGETVLDVATGHGNAALAAARRGAQVTGLDITPELLALARERAGAASLDIEFVEGDAEALPFADASFDRVTSVFGVMFAPVQERAAAELLRVCRPGGTVVVTAWTAEGVNGALLATIGRHLPPPPDGLRPPTAWGSEARVRELFAGAEVSCELRTAPDGVRAPSVTAWVDKIERALGPIVVAKRMLERDGRWEAARVDVLALFENANEASDGSLLAPPEYLLTVARPAAASS